MPFPRRLIDGDDRAARLLRAELDRTDAASPPDFEALRVRRARGQARTQRLLAAALALGATALFFASREPTREFSITAEAALRPAPAPAERRDPLSPQPPTASTASPTRSNVPTMEPRSAELAPGTPKAAGARQMSSAARSDTDCKSVISASGYEAGARCYGDRAERGSGVGAELAWMERARIESRALGRPNDALETLAAYERRFPNGALATEARLTSIELLAATGRREEALRAIAEAAPRIVERAASLHLLGARLALESNSCELAREHLDAAARAHAPAERIEALRGQAPCFASAGPDTEAK